MHETYRNPTKLNTKARIDLVGMKYCYMQSKYQIFLLIDFLVQKKSNISKDIIAGKISEFLFDLKKHQ
jgi:hypothetical protein